MYSGAIYSLNDIKIELYKQLNRFLFINDLQPNKTDVDGEFFIHSKIIVFYPKSFFNIQNYSANKSANKNINQNTIFGYKSIKLIIEKNITSSPNPNLPTLFAILLVLFFFILKKISRDPFVGHYQ
jgi:hypothetical protein